MPVKSTDSCTCIYRGAYVSVGQQRFSFVTFLIRLTETASERKVLIRRVHRRKAVKIAKRSKNTFLLFSFDLLVVSGSLTLRLRRFIASSSDSCQQDVNRMSTGGRLMCIQDTIFSWIWTWIPGDVMLREPFLAKNSAPTLQPTRNAPLWTASQVHSSATYFPPNTGGGV